MARPSSITVGAATIGLLAALASACAKPAEPEAGGPGATAAEHAEALSAYNELVTLVYGTQQQRRVGQKYVWLNIQSAIAACAKRRGITYSIPEFADATVADRYLAPGDLTAFAPLNEDFGIADRHIRLAAQGEPRNAEFLALDSDAERAAYLDRLEPCQNAGAAYEDSGFPAEHEELAEALINELAVIEQNAELAPALAEYKACLIDQGTAASSWTELRQDAERAFPPYPTAPTDVTKDAEFSRAAKYEKRAANADAACRAPLRDSALVRAEPVVSRFGATHSVALDRMAAGWEQRTTGYERLAKRLGLPA